LADYNWIVVESGVDARLADEQFMKIDEYREAAGRTLNRPAHERIYYDGGKPWHLRREEATQ
jgi:hypothetical protein